MAKGTRHPNVFDTCGATTWNELENTAIRLAKGMRLCAVAKSFAYYNDRRIVAVKGKNNTNKEISVFKCQNCTWQVKFIKRRGTVKKTDPWYLDIRGLPSDWSLEHEPGCHPVEVLTHGDILRNSLSLREHLRNNRDASRGAISDFLWTTEKINLSQMTNSSFFDARRNILNLLEMEVVVPTDEVVMPADNDDDEGVEGLVEVVPTEGPADPRLLDEGLGALTEVLASADPQPLHDNDGMRGSVDHPNEDHSVQFSLEPSLAPSEQYLDAVTVIDDSHRGTADTVNSSVIQPSDGSSTRRRCADEQAEQDVFFSTDKRDRSVSGSTIQPAKQKLRASSSSTSSSRDWYHHTGIVDSSSVEDIMSIKFEELSLTENGSIAGPPHQSVVSGSVTPGTVTSFSIRQQATTVSSMSKSTPSLGGSLAFHNNRAQSRRRMANNNNVSGSESVSSDSKSKGSSASSRLRNFSGLMNKMRAARKTPRSQSMMDATRLDVIRDKALTEDGWIEGKTAVNDVMSCVVEVMEHDRVQEGTLNQGISCLLGLLIIKKNRSESIPAPASTIRQIVKAMQDHPQSEPLQQVGCSALFILTTSTHSENQTTITAERGIEAVIKAMSGYSRNEHIQKDGCRMLRSFAVENMDSEAANAAAKGYALLVAIVAVHTENEVVQKESLYALRSLFANLSHCIQHEHVLMAIQIVTRSLCNFVGNPGIQRHGYRLLRDLAVADPVNAAAVAAEKGSLQRIVQTMRRYEKNADIQRDCCSLLNVIAIQDDKELVTHFCSEYIEEVLKAMQLHQHDAAIQKEACCVLNRMAFSDVPSGRTQLACIDAILQAMHLHEDNLSIQLECCCFLGHLTYNGQQTPAFLNGVVEMIARAMRIHEWNEEIQTQGFIALCLEELRSALVATESAGVIFQAMYGFKHNVSIQRDGCRVIRRLVEHQDIRGESEMKRIAEVVTQAMVTHKGDRDVQADCCFLLRHLLVNKSENNASNTALCNIASGCVEPILPVLSAHHNDEDSQADAFRILRCLADGFPEVESKITGSRGIQSILGGMKVNKVNVDIQRDGLFVLNQLASENPQNSSKIVSESGLEIVFEALRLHRTDADIQRQGFRLLQSLPLVYANNGSLSSLAAGEGVEVILDAMRHHDKDPVVQREGCRALHNLATAYRTNQSKIAEAHGIQRIVEAMSLHTEDEGLQEEGCRLFRHLTAGGHGKNKTAIGNANGIQTVVFAMERNATHPGIQRESCRALESLATQHPRNQTAITDANGMHLILRAMRLHEENKGIQKDGCSALYALINGHSRNHEALVVGNGIEVMVQAMFVHSSSRLQKVVEQTLLCIINQNDEGGSTALAARTGIELLRSTRV